MINYKKECENLKEYFVCGESFNIEILSNKNLCAKTVTKNNAYEIWQTRDKSWTWYILKKWQADDNKKYARWFCDVVTPICPNGELGDVYVSEIKQNAIRIK